MRISCTYSITSREASSLSSFSRRMAPSFTSLSSAYGGYAHDQLLHDAQCPAKQAFHGFAGYRAADKSGSSGRSTRLQQTRTDAPGAMDFGDIAPAAQLSLSQDDAHTKAVASRPVEM